MRTLILANGVLVSSADVIVSAPRVGDGGRVRSSHITSSRPRRSRGDMARARATAPRLVWEESLGRGTGILSSFLSACG